MTNSNSQTSLDRRVRRLARRQGLSLLKAIKLNAQINTHGGYQLRDDETSKIVFGNAGYPFSADLDEIEAYLKRASDKEPPLGKS